MINPSQVMPLSKIIFVKPSEASFVRVDVEALEELFVVKSFVLNPRKSTFYFVGRLLAMIWFILAHLRGSVAIVTWFVDYHAALLVFIGKCFGKKVIIFAGGQEAICYPELKKGVFCGKFRGQCAAYAINNAWHLIPNHGSLLFHENFYYDPSGKKDGFQHYIQNFRTSYTIIPNGIDQRTFFRDPSIEKERNLVLTVATMHNSSDFINKGLDLLIEVARQTPELAFVIIGMKEKLREWAETSYRLSALTNLTVLGVCPQSQLFTWYNKASVYVQASITEGMPNTLGEAMLCECVPVGSNVNGIPDAIGQTGVIVYHRSADELGAAIRQALTMHTGMAARAHVLSAYTKEKRKMLVQNLFNKLIAQ